MNDGRSETSESNILPETQPNKNKEIWHQWAEVAKTKWFDGLLQVTQGLGVISVASSIFLQRAKLEISQIPSDISSSSGRAIMHKVWMDLKPIAENLPPIIRDHMGNANSTFLMMSCALPMLEMATNSIGTVPERLLTKAGFNAEKVTQAREKLSQMTPYVFMTLLALHSIDIETTQFIPHHIFHIAAGTKDLADIPAGLAGIWAGFKIYQLMDNKIFKSQREEIRKTMQDMTKKPENTNNASLDIDETI